MRTNIKKRAGQPANQLVLTPEKFQEQMAHIEQVYKWLESFRERLDHLKVVGSVRNIDELRKLYS